MLICGKGSDFSYRDIETNLAIFRNFADVTKFIPNMANPTEPNNNPYINGPRQQMNPQAPSYRQPTEPLPSSQTPPAPRQWAQQPRPEESASRQTVVVPRVVTPAPQYGPDRYAPRVIEEQPASSSGKGKIIGIVAGVLLLLGIGGFVYYIAQDDASEETAALEVKGTENQEITNEAGATQAEEQDAAAESGVGAAQEELSLFNRPLTYAGTVTPGGAASLNVILFQNGRIEGSIDYAGGKSMPVYGSFTWTDNGHKMNVNLTASSNSDPNYSESWMGSSSYIKDDLAHTLTFSRINTSTGQSMTASFALKP